MTGTYRRTTVWTFDGENRCGHGRKSRSKDKPMARRVKRREHDRITRDAVQSWYADGADDLYEYMYSYDWEDQFLTAEEAWAEEYDRDHDDDHYEYEDYNDYSDLDYYDDWATEYHPEDRYLHPYIQKPIEYCIRPNDVGKTLNELINKENYNGLDKH